MNPKRLLQRLIAITFLTQTHFATTVIKDIEIESLAKILTVDIIDKAGLSTKDTEFVILQDSNINAFVSGGERIYVFTGLIEKMSEVTAFQAVIAHELAHIHNHDVALSSNIIGDLTPILTLSTLFGIATTLFIPVLGLGIIGVGSQYAYTKFSNTSQTKESRADRTGLEFFQQLNYDPYGFYSAFNVLMTTYGVNKNIPGYLQTHPFIDQRVLNFSNNKYPSTDPVIQARTQKHQLLYDRIRYKLIANSSNSLPFKKEALTPATLNAHYANGLYYLKQQNIQEAIQYFKEIITLEPNNPYFYEALGEAYQKINNLNESIQSYEQALRLKPDHELVVLQLAANLLERGSDKDLTKALSIIQSQLHQTTLLSSLAWKTAARIYGKQNNQLMSLYSNAHYLALSGNVEFALKDLEKVLYINNYKDTRVTQTMKDLYFKMTQQPLSDKAIDAIIQQQKGTN